MPGFYCKATMAAPRSYAVLKRKTLLLLLLAPVLAASIAYQLDQFDPAPMPVHEFSRTPVTASLRNNRMLQGAEYVGFGQLPGPEDIAYHRESQLIYTGCRDGWVKQVPVNESVGQSVVKEWVNTGGRPLGLAFGRNNEVIVADAYKGLLNLSRDGEVELLTEEADGVKFRLTDAVDVAENGLIYFTDASYKYNFETYIFDLLEGKPHGRFMSFDPHTRKTKVLLRDLYFANGVAVSPNQDHVIFCETPMRRCRRYYIKGNKKRRVEKFIDDLPGLPDNIRYDGQGHYWIGLAVGVDWSWNLGTRYPFLRKVMAILEKCKWLPNISKNGGVLAVDLDGKPVAHYYDIGLSLVSSGIKIANHLYCSSLYYPYILRLNLEKHPAQSID